MKQEGLMKIIAIIGITLSLLACAGGTKQDTALEHEIYHEKRVECETTKNTDETANITQCVRNKPDQAKK